MHNVQNQSSLISIIWIQLKPKFLLHLKKLFFDYDENLYDQDSLGNHLRIIGYYPIFNNEEQLKERKKDRIDLIVAFIFSLPLLWTMFHHLGLPIGVPDILMNGYVQWAISTPVLFFCRKKVFTSAFHQIKGKNLGMDVLVVIGTTAAYLYSIIETITFKAHGEHLMPELYFETTAVIILMVLIGNYFENRVKEKNIRCFTIFN